MKLFLLLILISVSYSTLSLAQEVTVGIVAGPTLTYTSVSSDREVNMPDYRPGIGYNVGALARIKLSEKFSANMGVSFDRRRDKDNSVHRTSTFNNQSFIDINNSIIINNYLKSEVSFSYNLKGGFAIGSGLNLYGLIDSRTKFKMTHISGLFSNHHYRSFNLNVPVFASYNSNKIFFRLIFDKGVISRISDRSSSLRERENTLTFQGGYFFMKKTLN